MFEGNDKFEKRMKKMEDSLFWTNIFILLLCLCLGMFAVGIGHKLSLHADAILEIADILTKKGLR